MRFLPVLLLAGTSLVFGQRYEVASIKPADPGAQGVSINVNKGGLFTATNVSLKALITMAYDVREHQITGAPNWLTSESWNISARPENYAENTARKVPQAEMRAMARSLLTERFKLVSHIETREGPVYSLVLAKGGSKMRENTSGSGRQGSNGRRGELTGYRLSMPSFAKWISEEVSRTVVDNTGLNGEFDFQMKWAPDLAQPDAGATSDGPSIFTAVQEQLGLKLIPAKGPVEVLVIDHAEKPTDN